MMTLKVKLSFFVIAFFHLSTLLGQTNGYPIYYEECNNCNTTSQSYDGFKTLFVTNDISSDFGRRRGTFISNWHRGIDYNNNNNYVGDHLFSIVDGDVAKIFVTGASYYKVIVIDGIRDMGYGHIFEEGSVSNNGMTYGDMVLKRMEYPNDSYYAIFDLGNGIAFGEALGYIEYPEGSQNFFPVTSQVDTESPIAVLGRSGGSSSYHYDYHLHLYSFENINVATQSPTGYGDVNNDKDPIEFVDHVLTVYDVTLEGKSLQINNQNYIDANDIVIFPGTEEISIKVKYEMVGGIPGNRYSNVVMDIDNVELFMKKSSDEDEFYYDWGTASSNYQFIKGPWFESYISHGARLNNQRYYSNGLPTNNSLDLSDNNREGSTTKTGIYPTAYTDPVNGIQLGEPFDEFYYSDFKTRIHKNDNFGQNQCNYARSNDYSEARYQDGKYELFAKATNVNGEIYTSSTSYPLELIIDNFRPFVKKVEIRKDIEGEATYTREWLWNGNAYSFSPPPCPKCPEIDNNDNLYIKVYASEPMTDMSLNLNGYSILNSAASIDQTEWDFVINASNLVIGANTLIIDGSDLANNNVINDPTIVPIRQSNGNWLPNPIQITAPDQNHVFYAFEPNPVDFEATQIGDEERTVKFVDKSTVANPIGYYWNFGDGNTGSGEIVEHQFWVAGTWPVTHSVSTSSGTNSVTKNILVEDLEIPEANFIYSIIPNGSKNSTISVDFFDQSEGIISTWEWTWTSSNGSFTSFEQNPRQDLEIMTYYDISLKVGNYAGNDTYIYSSFYYDPSTSPNVTITPWQTLSYFYNIDVAVTNLQGPYTYEIDFGDGTSQIINNESLNWKTFEHQYFIWGTYLITAKVTGLNNETGFSAHEVSVTSWDADVELSYHSSSEPPAPGCEKVEIAATINGLTGAEYSGTWYITKNGDPEFYYTSYTGTGQAIDPLIYSFPDEGTYKVGLDLVILGSGGIAHGEIEIDIVNAPEFIQAGFYPLEPIVLGLNSNKTFENSSWPIGNPGVSEESWYPTNLRWTLFAPDGSVVQSTDGVSEEEFSYYLFNQLHYEEYEFNTLGNYLLRLEVWNNQHNYEEDDLLDSDCAANLSYYDVVEKQITVSTGTPYLEVVYPNPPEFLALNAEEHTLQIQITNPGIDVLTWEANPYPDGSDKFIEIKGQFTGTLNNGSTATIDIKVLENTNPDIRFGNVTITGKNSLNENVQGSPTYVNIDQAGTNGLSGQFVYNNPPIEDENFGSSVAIDNNYAVIGAVDDNQDGKVFVVMRNNIGDWSIVAQLLASNSYIDNFGRSVDIHDKYIIVGAWQKAYIFKRPSAGWQGTIYPISSSTGSNSYGYKVSIWDDWAVVSEHENDQVKIFYRNQTGTDSWGLNKTISGSTNSDFGYNIDLYNDVLGIGVPSLNNGEIHIYNRNNSSSNDWGLEKVITVPNGPSDAYLGGKGFDIYDNWISFTYRDFPVGSVPYLSGITYARGDDGNWNQVLNSFSQGETLYSETGFFNTYAGNNTAINPNHYLPDVTSSSILYSKAYDCIGDYTDNEGNHNLLGGSVTLYPYRTWAPSDIPEIYELWNTNSSFGYSLETDFNTIVVGGPNKNGSNNQTSINDCGAVFIEDNRIRSLCAAGIELELINFDKPAGQYSKVEARKIILGGKGYDATINAGADIEYQAEEILLEDGFLADDGSDFLASYHSCQDEVDQLRLPENINFVNESSFTDLRRDNTTDIDYTNFEAIRIAQIKRRIRNEFPGYPWYTVDFLKDISKIEILDTKFKSIQVIINPNPIICLINKDLLPNEYYLKVSFKDKSIVLKYENSTTRTN